MVQEEAEGTVPGSGPWGGFDFTPSVTGAGEDPQQGRQTPRLVSSTKHSICHRECRGQESSWEAAWAPGEK